MDDESLNSPDVLDQFPELKRARNLYAQLFQGRAPLVYLGYHGYKLDRVVETLKLIEGAGKIQTFAKFPFLEFKKPPDAETEHYDDLIHISENPDRKGYNLCAQHKEMGRKFSSASTEEDVMLNEVVHSTSQELGLDHELAAQIYLLKDQKDLDNLDHLAKLVLDTGFAPYESLCRHDVFAKTQNKLGAIVPTFEAIWLDDKRKEFMVKGMLPTRFPSDDPDSSSSYYHCKILVPIKDDQGAVYPFGLKWTPEDTIKRRMTEKQYTPAIGRLALQPVKA